MEIVLTETPADAAERVATEILTALAKKPSLVLGLATGSTPIQVYERLREARQSGEADFSQVRTFNLDEYLDLPPDHPQSYRTFMRDHLFAGLGIPPEQIHFPPSEGSQLVQRCGDYEDAIVAAGGIDIQLLGMGRNGHVGFNEPTSSIRSRTRLKTLTQRTLDDNARFYADGEAQPTLASTMGIGTILDARRILLQAYGVKKANAVRACVEGPVSSFFPASALQLHANTTCYFDPEAAQFLAMTDYYRETRKNKEALAAAGRM
ncbi:MAG: glucosamine-6-phosphate deaminase [Planctomycetes bacterium]|nr:glucosamine-6-phosphate deaminase [Planctomycetota bacterium]